MRCERVHQFYDDYSRGGLPVATLTRLEEHLAACAQCREHYETQDRIAEAMRQMSEVAHPGASYFENLTSKVLERLNSGEGTDQIGDPERWLAKAVWWRRPLWWSGALAAAALLALALISSGLVGPRDPLGSAQQFAANMGPPSESQNHLSEFKVVSASDTRTRELVFPGLVEPGSSGGSEVGVDGKTLEKGVTGVAGKSQEVENMIAGPSRQGVEPAAATADPSSAPPADRGDGGRALPPDISQQIGAVGQQMAIGGEKLTQALQELNRVAALHPERADLKQMALVRQAEHYVAAEQALQAGRPVEAATSYMHVLRIDTKGPLATRASLQLADLNYDEWADFKAARDYYQGCQVAGAIGALSQPEQQHIAFQLDRLARFSDNSWEALGCLHAIEHGEWPEARAALGRLMELPRIETLLPKASRSIVERAKVKPAPAEENGEIYNLLEKRVAVEQNGEVRAWLELALGDLAFGQFQNVQQALEHYRRVKAAAPESAATAEAQLKQNELREFSLNNRVK